MVCLRCTVITYGEHREVYDLFTVSGILSTTSLHDGALSLLVARSPMRGPYQAWAGQGIALRYLDSKRDWGFAGDYVRAMYLHVAANSSEDFVIAMGRTHAVRDLVKIAFECVDLPWKNTSYRSGFIRPAEVDLLVGDARKQSASLNGSLSISRTDD